MASILAFLAILSLLLALWQWVAAWRFPLHRRVADGSFRPGVTILKPMKGWDDETANCLRSWLKQDYTGQIQVLFGVASRQDAAVGPVSQLIKDHLGCNAQLVVCEESLGVNGKVSTLIQLLRRAENEVIVVSDADVWVPADYLVNAVAPLSAPEIGLVNSFYRLANPATVAMRCEAVAINADFWSQVLQGQTLQPLDFALGAVMTTRREQLVKIGGFETLADYLADDFQLGNRIVRAGGRIALCPVVVDCFSPAMDWREVWLHQLRWSRTIRVCKPLPYAFSILSNATFWPLLWLLARPVPAVALAAGCCVLLRVGLAQDLQRRLGAVAGTGRHFWLAPVKDLMQFALWLLAFFGRHIEWRGQRFRLQRDGKLVRA